MVRFGIAESYWSAQTFSSSSSADLSADSYLQSAFAVGLVGDIITNTLSLTLNYQNQMDAPLAGNSQGVELNGRQGGSTLSLSLSAQF